MNATRFSLAPAMTPVCLLRMEKIFNNPFVAFNTGYGFTILENVHSEPDICQTNIASAESSAKLHVTSTNALSLIRFRVDENNQSVVIPANTETSRGTHFSQLKQYPEDHLDDTNTGGTRPQDASYVLCAETMGSGEQNLTEPKGATGVRGNTAVSLKRAKGSVGQIAFNCPTELHGSQRNTGAVLMTGSNDPAELIEAMKEQDPIGPSGIIIDSTANFLWRM